MAGQDKHVCGRVQRSRIVLVPQEPPAVLNAALFHATTQHPAVIAIDQLTGNYRQEIPFALIPFPEDSCRINQVLKGLLCSWITHGQKKEIIWHASKLCAHCITKLRIALDGWDTVADNDSGTRPIKILFMTLEYFIGNGSKMRKGFREKPVPFTQSIEPLVKLSVRCEHDWSPRRQPVSGYSIRSTRVIMNVDHRRTEPPEQSPQTPDSPNVLGSQASQSFKLNPGPIEFRGKFTGILQTNNHRGDATGGKSFSEMDHHTLHSTGLKFGKDDGDAQFLLGGFVSILQKRFPINVFFLYAIFAYYWLSEF